MPQFKASISHTVLLVDHDEAFRAIMGLAFACKGFDVIPAGDAAEALRLIAMESFDVLIIGPGMLSLSDGFAVLAAMRRSQPRSLTLLVGGYTGCPTCGLLIQEVTVAFAFGEDDEWTFALPVCLECNPKLLDDLRLREARLA